MKNIQLHEIKGTGQSWVTAQCSCGQHLLLVDPDLLFTVPRVPKWEYKYKNKFQGNTKNRVEQD